MPIGQSRIPAFDQYLRAAGVPFAGVSMSGNAPEGVTIQFLPEATAEQQQWAETAKLEFDWRRRLPASLDAIVTVVSGYTAQQQNALLRRLICKTFREQPSLALEFATALGVSLPVEDVDPDWESETTPPI